MKRTVNIIKRIKIGPSQVILMSFLVVIIVGAILLNLPIASQTKESVGFVNSLFTATSAVCVTGLVVVDTATFWSNFGKIIIMILIQIGGLGFMTFVTMTVILFGKKITLSNRLVLKEALGQDKIKGITTLIKKIVKGTFFIEGVAILLLTLFFVTHNSIGRSIYLALFHSMSAFCNAGFDIMQESSLTGYRESFFLNFVIMSLIILGGLGFSVWIDVINGVKKSEKKRQWFSKLSLHTKLVLIISTVLIVFPTILFFLLEYNNVATLGNLRLDNKILASLFQSVTTRTAGFNTIDTGAMSETSKFLTIMLMFIGGSPVSTAGGIKTVTFGVLILAAISTIKGKGRVEVFNRRIPKETIDRATALIVISLGVVILTTMILLLSEGQKFSFLQIFFETVSAFGTVGLSTGITDQLSYLGKIIITIVMFIGRLGPITFILGLQLKGEVTVKIEQPEEKVVIG